MSHRSPLVVAAAASLIASGAVPPAGAQTIERISVAGDRGEADAPSSAATRPSDDGRYVVFESLASNLFGGDAPGTRDVFQRDRLLGTTTRVLGDASVEDLSADGALLGYTVLVDQPAPPVARPMAHVLELASSADTELTPGATSASPRFSGDGLHVVYVSGGPPALHPTVLVRRELASGAEIVLSETTSGGLNTQLALPAAVAFDASLVTFTSADPELVPGDGNGVADAFYRDLSFGFTDRTSLSDGFAELAQGSLAGAFSADTRFFLFSSADAGVVLGDANGVSDLFVNDRFLGTITPVSVDAGGVPGDGATSTAGAWISPDGERIVFSSRASDLVADDTNGVRDVFERNTITNTTRRLVLGLSGAEPDQAVELLGVSGDGRFLTLVSAASNLVPGDLNGVADVFLVDLGPQCRIAGHCSALANSTGKPAAIGATGTPSFTLNNLVLSALDLPTSATCIFFMATARREVPISFGNGLMCVDGAVQRLGALHATGGSVIQFQDLHSFAYAGVGPGDVRHFQLHYRDAAGGGAGFNTSAALEIAFCP